MNNSIDHIQFSASPNDQKTRDEVISPEHSFIVQAPAGSGKTELLVNRFLTLLSVVNNPEEIVALTFTKKSAREMLNRITERLHFAKHSPNKLTKEVYDICLKVIARDKQLGWNLLQNSQRLGIFTIDAFCLKLANQLPWTTGLGESPKVMDDTAHLYKQAVSQVMDIAFNKESQNAYSAAEIDQLTGAIQLLLFQHNYNLSNLQDKLVQLLGKRVQWLPFVFDDDSFDNLREHLESIWQQIIIDELAVVDDLLRPYFNNDLKDTLAYMANNLIADGKSDIEICVYADKPDWPSVCVEDIPLWQGLVFALLTKENIVRSRLDKNMGFPPKDEDVVLHKSRIKSLVENFKTTPNAEFVINKVRNLPPAQYSEESWQQIQAIYTILKHCALELVVVFKENGTVDHDEISSRVILALQENASLLGLKLDYQIQHILIDEFQDTSSLQLNLLSALTKEWHQNDSRTLFLVGDPMQSIYRFRAANVAGFINIFNNGLDNIDIHKKVLTTNFRSSKNIVDWVNESFQYIFPLSRDIAKNDILQGAVSYSPSIAFNESSANSNVNCHVIGSPHIDNEADQIALSVKDFIKDNQDCPKQNNQNYHIAILVRNKSHAKAIIASLHSANIQISNIDINLLNLEPAVLDAAALTKAFIHFGDDISWAALLRAPWSGLCLDDISVILHNRQNKTIWQCMQFALENNLLSLASHARLKHLCFCIFNNLYLYELPLHRRVRMCWQSLLDIGADNDFLNDSTVTHNDVANVNLFLQNVLLKEEAGNIADTSIIDDIISSLHTVDNQEHISSTGVKFSIEIMTIHKSKGLQFDQVILPGLSRQSLRGDYELLSWFEYLDDASKQSINLVSGFKDSTIDDSVSRNDYIQKIAKQGAIYENARLLYVAATRAVSRLDIFFYNTKPFKNTYSQILNHAFRATKNEKLLVISDALSNTPEKKPAGTRPYVDDKLLRFTNDYLSLIKTTNNPVNLPESIPPSFQWAGLHARIKGILIHEYLCDCAGQHQQLGKVSDNLIAHWQQQFMRHGLLSKECEDLKKSLIKDINAMLDDKRLTWILSPSHNSQHNEWPITTIAHIDSRMHKKHLIIDRCFVDEEGFRWIIDYKTGSHQGGNLDAFLDAEQARYQEIMEIYAKAVNVYDQEKFPIKIGLYFPLVKAWRSWNYKTM